MEIKSSKIEEIHQIKPYNNSHGTTYYHLLLLENGDKIEIGKKKEMKVGWEITYSIVDDQHEYNKAKSEQPQGQNVFAKKTQGNTNGKSHGNVASFALSYAKDYAGFHVAKGVDFTPEQIMETATKFNDWLKSNS